jgi:hypothetical protein
VVAVIVIALGILAATGAFNQSSSNGSSPGTGGSGGGGGGSGSSWIVKIEAVDLSFDYNGTSSGFFETALTNLCSAQCPAEFSTEQIALTLWLNVTNTDTTTIEHCIWFGGNGYEPISPSYYGVEYSPPNEPGYAYEGPFCILDGHTAEFEVNIWGGPSSSDGVQVTDTIYLLLPAT